MIFYSNVLVPVGSAGCARGPFIFIRPEYKDDIGLLAHEQVHVRQAWQGFFVFHAVLYWLEPSYRLDCEVEAYREQARHYADDRRWKFAGFIAAKYKLDISQADAYELLA